MPTLATGTRAPKTTAAKPKIAAKSNTATPPGKASVQRPDSAKISKEAQEPETRPLGLLAALMENGQVPTEPSAESIGKMSYEKQAFIRSSGSFSAEARESASEGMTSKPEYKAARKKSAEKMHATWSKLIK